MLALKLGVDPIGIRPELLLGIMVVAAAFEEYSHDCTITSLSDSKHSATSLHYSGAAADFRTRHCNAEEVADVFARATHCLTADYDLLDEGDHLHLEWQPKR